MDPTVGVGGVRFEKTGYWSRHKHTDFLCLVDVEVHPNGQPQQTVHRHPGRPASSQWDHPHHRPANHKHAFWPAASWWTGELKGHFTKYGKLPENSHWGWLFIFVSSYCVQLHILSADFTAVYESECPSFDHLLLLVSSLLIRRSERFWLRMKNIIASCLWLMWVFCSSR